MSRYSGRGDRSGGTTARQKVRAQKRAEAEVRNAHTLDQRRRAARRDPVLVAMAKIRAGKAVLS